MSDKVSTKKEKQISYTDPEWTEYVISQMRPEEFWNGIPKIDGLRRMVELLISPITEIHMDIQMIQGSVITVVAVAEVTLANGEIYSAASDATPWSVGGAFKNRLTAIADNRAKSKAYREALRLNNISSSDEISNSEDLDAQEGIIDSQKMMILSLMKDTKTDLEEALAGFPNVKTFDVLKHSQAAEIIKMLSDKKRGKN